jgi:hypothetical protein
LTLTVLKARLAGIDGKTRVLRQQRLITHPLDELPEIVADLLQVVKRGTDEYMWFHPINSILPLRGERGIPQDRAAGLQLTNQRAFHTELLKKASSSVPRPSGFSDIVSLQSG